LTTTQAFSELAMAALNPWPLVKVDPARLREPMNPRWRVVVE
jgi:hypothetical protein